MSDSNGMEDAGSLRVGPTDKGMVRIIVATPAGEFELDFPPEEAEDIAQELTASAEIARSRGA